MVLLDEGQLTSHDQIVLTTSALYLILMAEKNNISKRSYTYIW